MTLLSSETVLDLWEAGLPMTPAARAVLLLEAASGDTASDLPVGARDHALLGLYGASNGRVAAMSECPQCDADLDVAVNLSELPAASHADRLVDVAQSGCHVIARLPTAGDLAALVPSTDADELQYLLLERCVLESTRDGVAIDVRSLSAEVIEAVDTAMDEADPSADISVALTCAECGAGWSELLDPVRFVWAEVESSARRLATDVHSLAQAYGWSEREILDLSPFRRQLYLSAVQ